MVVEAAGAQPGGAPAPTSRPPRAGTSGPRALLAGLREVALVVVAALVVSFLVKTFLLQVFWIPSESMEDTLAPGDRVAVSKLTPGPFALHRGDVVVFADPGGWLRGEEAAPTGHRSVAARALTVVGVLPDPTTKHLVKRVIGLPGDVVACCTTAGLMTVDGVPLREDYLAPGATAGPPTFTVTVPAHHLWVEGDNRQDSKDSRFHTDLPGGGSVDEDLVVGRAAVVLWPLPRWRWLGDHPRVFARVPSPG